MRAFERAYTGIKGLDRLLDNLRWGDNVVWQVEDIKEYKNIVMPFVDQALHDSHRVVYLRFGQHEPLLESNPTIILYELDATQGFEAFSSRIHAIATEEGEGVCYIFDCLSDLLSAWATDLMIGNFFRVTCPYLFQLNTIAYFAVFKNMISYQAIARIRDTTQLLLDLYRYDQQLYIHPLKVWNRYSPTMFLPHVASGEEFVPITSSVDTAMLFSRLQQQGPGNVERKLDYWDRIFLHAQEMVDWQEKGLPQSKLEQDKMLAQLCSMILGREEKVLSLARKYFSMKDLLEIRNRLIGSGYIGGKAVGMLLARKILQHDERTDWSKYLEPHDSFYVGSDVFYTYLVENDCWTLRQRQKKPEHYFACAEELRQKILLGNIPGTISEQFHQLLEYFGQSPIIVRSSSLLEDGFGNAFAGKYESIFCVNQDSPQERLIYFERAVKKIFASTMNEDALTYRLQRGLADQDEQMALLVQRVSGSHRSHYFFPDLAGVGLSHNPYVWRKDLNPKAGMLRLVMGLGTRAVDRVEDDYPMIVALDKPSLRPVNNEDRKRFSQHGVDLLDTAQNCWDTVPLQNLVSLLSTLPYWGFIASRDQETARRRSELGLTSTDSWILNFDKLLKDTPFAQKMSNMLGTLEEAYAYPVDIEFTINFAGDGVQINLLQCRPLQTSQSLPGEFVVRDYAPQDILFSSAGNAMGGNIQQKLGWIVYVDAGIYHRLPVQDKYQVARLVGRLNRIINEKNTDPYILIGPGRWGSSTPSLGVPVSFAEICHARVLVEVADPVAGFMPELSFGTHFFQDLVETQIFYTALFPSDDDVIFNRQLLNEAKNAFTDLLPEYNNWETVIKVINLHEQENRLYLNADMENQKTVCFFAGEC
jgi:hypothetical protein